MVWIGLEARGYHLCETVAEAAICIVVRIMSPRPTPKGWGCKFCGLQPIWRGPPSYCPNVLDDVQHHPLTGRKRPCFASPGLCKDPLYMSPFLLFICIFVWNFPSIACLCACNYVFPLTLSVVLVVGVWWSGFGPCAVWCSIMFWMGALAKFRRCAAFVS